MVAPDKVAKDDVVSIVTTRRLLMLAYLSVVATMLLRCSGTFVSTGKPLPSIGSAAEIKASTT